MTGFRKLLRISSVAMLAAIIGLGSFTAYGASFKDQKLLIKKARKNKVMTEKYRYMYYKHGIVYSPKKYKDKSVDFLK